MNRKELIKFLNSEKTFNEVLGIINHKLQKNGVVVGDYPMHYFIAGGSIANTIYYLLNKEKFEEPVINDIDMFFFNNVLGYDWGSNNLNSFIHTNLSNVVAIDGYGRTWFGPSGETMRMFGSERFGIVNKVSINVFKQSIQNFNETNYYKTLLTVFDLNCCMAGLDRINNKIIYTEDFLDFLESNMIEVTNVSQPLQTSIRLKNKIKQLKSDGSNFNKELLLIKHSFINKKIHSIGPEWMKKVKDNREFVLEHFNFNVKNPNPAENIFDYTVKDFEIEKYYNNFDIFNNQKLIAFWKLFVRRKNEEALNKVLTFYNNIFMGLTGGKNITNQETVIYESETNLNRLLGSEIRFSSLDFVSILSLSPKYFDCDFTIEDLERVHNFNDYIQKEMFSNASIFVTKNISEHLKMINYVKKVFVDKNGMFRQNLLTKIVYRSRLDKKNNLTVLDYEEKIKIFKKLVNGIWIKSYNSHGKFGPLSHRFLPNKKLDLNLIDFEW